MGHIFRSTETIQSQEFGKCKNNKYINQWSRKDKLHLWILNYKQYWLMRLLSKARSINKTVKIGKQVEKVEKILTVTVASYNVEKFLENTLDSFVDERVLDDIEVLIVDDGSKDKTAEIGRKYEEKYPDTFRVISKENGARFSDQSRDW